MLVAYLYLHGTWAPKDDDPEAAAKRTVVRTLKSHVPPLTAAAVNKADGTHYSAEDVELIVVVTDPDLSENTEDFTLHLVPGEAKGRRQKRERRRCDITDHVLGGLVAVLNGLPATAPKPSLEVDTRPASGSGKALKRDGKVIDWGYPPGDNGNIDT